ncbi:MAG: MarC family protein [Opitutales bacterium]
MPSPEELITAFVLLWAVIDPIGTIPVYISATTGMSEADHRRIARSAAIIAAGILLFFIIAGEVLLTAMGVPLTAFQIAGGIILFLFALTMVFGTSKPDEEMQLARSVEATAVFPLATPSIASLGAMMAVVLLTENANHSFIHQACIAALMAVVVFVAYVLMRCAGPISQRIGEGGASIVSRVMGMILAAIAATNVLEGIRLYYM